MSDYSFHCEIIQFVSEARLALLTHRYQIDEAGFDIFVGSPESVVPSALYSEKAYVMSKGFIKVALTTPPQGLSDVLEWLYVSHADGPCLLRRVVEDCQGLLARSSTTSESSKEEDEEGNKTLQATVKLSTGALILLKRHSDWLEDFLKHNTALADQASSDTTMS